MSRIDTVRYLYAVQGGHVQSPLFSDSVPLAPVALHPSSLQSNKAFTYRTDRQSHPMIGVAVFAPKNPWSQLNSSCERNYRLVISQVISRVQTF